MKIFIRGAGDIASGIALRLHRAGFSVIMADIAKPTAIRRTVCFSQAILFGTAKVEDVTGVLAKTPVEIATILQDGNIAVIRDETGEMIEQIAPTVVVDGILAKKNLGTTVDMAPIVIGIGPGFTAGIDCHAVVETMRGHTLGRAIYHGSALPNTGIPGLIGGFAGERVLRAPDDGIFEQVLEIGDRVKMGDIAGYVNQKPMICTLDGTLRGILPGGTQVHKGMKSGDIDPRCETFHCYTASDKALAVGGGVLEAILHLWEEKPWKTK